VRRKTMSSSAGCVPARSVPSTSSWGPGVTAWGKAANDVDSAVRGCPCTGAADEAAVDGVAVDGVAVDGVAVDGVAVDGVAVDGVAVDGVAVDGVGGATTARAVIGAVVAISATGPLEVRGVIATTSAATARTAIVPPARASRFVYERWVESSTSRRVGPSSDGCRHDRS
jgi:hypothetical protein